MSNKKTGIVTLALADNYGAVLQSYSLYSYLNYHYAETEIIKFVPHFMIGRYSIISADFSSFGSLAKSILCGVWKLPVTGIKKIRFTLFRATVSKYSKKKYLLTIPDNGYDIYIVGSDQVFNFSLTNDDVEFLLPQIHFPKRKVTYAASFGMDELNEQQQSFVVKRLDEFEHISIREKTGCNIVDRLLPHRKVFHSIDPVFLFNSSFWSKIEKGRYEKSEYVLIYSFKNFELAYRLARKIDPTLKIFVISDSIRRRKADVKNIRAVGPREFLSLIHNAKCVITDSFHGTAFSIVFHKPFFSIPYQGTESRIIDLLSDLGLENRVVRNEDDMDQGTIDYTLVDDKITEFVKSTQKYFDIVYGR